MGNGRRKCIPYYRKSDRNRIRYMFDMSTESLQSDENANVYLVHFVWLEHLKIMLLFLYELMYFKILICLPPLASSESHDVFCISLIILSYL